MHMRQGFHCSSESQEKVVYVEIEVCFIFFFACLQPKCKVVTPKVYGTGSVLKVIIF